jgi:hypothetical protein
MKKKGKKSSSFRPIWLKRLSWRIFPRGPRGLYCYLAAFSTGQCWLYNYRLAATFDVTIRTIQLWLAWLNRRALIHTYWIHGEHRRIVAHHYKNATQWLAAAALPKPKKKSRRYKLRTAGNLSWADQTQAQFEARRQAQLSKLLGRKDLRPIT